MNSILRSSSFLLVVTIFLCCSSNMSNMNVYAKEIQTIQIIPIASQKSIQKSIHKQNVNAQLLIAAKNGNIAEVRSLISQATDVNVRDEYGWTPLLWAAMNGYTEVVQLLLAAGANPNTRNKYEWTPLMWAAGQGYGEIVRSLIASGARLNAQDRNGWTALMWAWDSKQEETVAILRNATRKN